MREGEQGRVTAAVSCFYRNAIVFVFVFAIEGLMRQKTNKYNNTAVLATFVLLTPHTHAYAYVDVCIDVCMSVRAYVDMSLAVVVVL